MSEHSSLSVLFNSSMPDPNNDPFKTPIQMHVTQKYQLELFHNSGWIEEMNFLCSLVFSILQSERYSPAGTWHNNNVIMTSKRNDVAIAFWHHNDVVIAVSVCWEYLPLIYMGNVMEVHHQYQLITKPGPRLNIKTVFPGYGDSHVKDKTAVRTSYL